MKDSKNNLKVFTNSTVFKQPLGSYTSMYGHSWSV